VTTGIIAVSGNRFQTLRVINGSNVRCDVPLAINNDNITFNATSTNTINLNGNNQIFKNIVSAGRNCNIFNNSPTAANLILNPTFPPTYLGGISGNINLIKSGVAFLGISGSLTGGLGAQVYTGSTTVTGGALVTYTPFSDPLARITSGVLGSSTSLVVGFRSSPANGESFRLLPGSTVNNYSIITLQGSAAGRTATYNGANSTLTLTN
jgi:hypothetical protein